MRCEIRSEASFEILFRIANKAYNTRSYRPMKKCMDAFQKHDQGVPHLDNSKELQV